MDSFDIIIAGGGMVGQSFALSMADQDLKIAIVEPNNSNPTLNDQFHTRVSAITPKSENLLEKLGAWNLIKRKYAFTDTKVWDQNSHGHLNFSSADEGLDHLGHIIENDVIQSALFEALSNTKVEFISAKLEGIKKTDDGYQVQLDNQDQISCHLLVAADGARSRIRELSALILAKLIISKKPSFATLNRKKGLKIPLGSDFYPTVLSPYCL